MRNWIEIDGKSSRDFGLAMARLPLWPIAAETIENTEIPGVPVEIDRHTGQYKDIELPLTAYMTTPVCRLPDIVSWLQHGKCLILSTQPQIHGIIRKVGQIAPVRIGTRANELRLPITCKPFKYRNQNFPVELTASPAYHRIWGNIYAEPVFELTVDTQSEITAIFSVNGVGLQIQTPALDTGKVIVDVPRRKIYKVGTGGTLTIIQQYTAGPFWRMVLQPGENTITWNAGITNVVMTPNERWL